jgi:FkbM family methyltransferase
MIPTMQTLEATAGQVLESVPDGVAQGRLPACLYGMGLLGRWALPNLKKNGVRVVRCYDANPMMDGVYVDGVPVLAASNLGTYSAEFTIVTARHAVQPVSSMLTNLSIPHVSYEAWYVASDFSTFRHIHNDVLGDERSKVVLRAILMSMLTGDRRYCEAVYERDQYFCLPRFCGSTNEIYVDAGAFVGDSLERFVWAQNGVFAILYAFEPGARQFSALCARAERLKTEWALNGESIVLVNAGLGEHDGKRRANSGGSLTSLAIGHSSGADAQPVTVLTLDNFLKEQPITFLKADVEGMELALLKGARSTIQRHKPKISICVYHYPADIPAISLYLKDLVPNYRFSLRHHSPQMMETVLYCWTD